MELYLCLWLFVIVRPAKSMVGSGVDIVAIAQIRKATKTDEVLGEVLGFVTFTQKANSVKVVVNETLVDIGNAGDHGFHIHEFGDMVSSDDCSSGGAHYNPLGQKHGGPDDSFRHIGDLGNLVVTLGNRNGETSGIEMSISALKLPLRGPHSIVGRMAVVHKNPDDFGKQGYDDSMTTGHSGRRVACGVIGIASHFAVAEGPVSDEKQPMVRRVAVARLRQATGTGVDGSVKFVQTKAGEQIKVTGTITGISPQDSLHGFHIHTMGNLTGNDCKAALSHYNPELKNHGNRDSDERHIGDLGNIAVDGSGKANFDFSIDEAKLPLVGPHSIVGRMVVLHSGKDDLGKGGNEESTKTGNAGKRLACGVIGISHIGTEESFSPGGTFGSGSRNCVNAFLVILTLFALTFFINAF